MIKIVVAVLALVLSPSAFACGWGTPCIDNVFIPHQFEPDPVRKPYDGGEAFFRAEAAAPMPWDVPKVLERARPLADPYQAPVHNQFDAPRIYNERGEYRGKLGGNPIDPDSTSNPYGRYGSTYSWESINNPATSSERLYVVPAGPGKYSWEENYVTPAGRAKHSWE